MQKRKPIIVTINKDSAVDILKGIHSEIFSVKFIKRTDGTIRWMTCRKGVKKGVKGIGQPFNPKDYNLLTVYDMNKWDDKKNQRGAFRMINLDTIQEIHFNHTYYQVK